MNWIWIKWIRSDWNRLNRIRLWITIYYFINHRYKKYNIIHSLDGPRSSVPLFSLNIIIIQYDDCILYIRWTDLSLYHFTLFIFHISHTTECITALYTFSTRGWSNRTDSPLLYRMWSKNKNTHCVHTVYILT